MLFLLKEWLMCRRIGFLLFFVMGFGSLIFAATGNIKISGDDQALASSLEPHCSLCETVFGGGPASLKSLKNKAKENTKSLLKKLSSLGYLDASIDLDIDKQFPFKVTFIVNPGVAFKTTSFNFTIQDPIVDQLRLLVPSEQNIFSFSDYENLRKKMENFLKRKGFARAKIDLPELHVDYEQKSVIPLYPIYLGKPYVFGNYEIEGKPDELDLGMIERRLLWKKGSTFDIELIEQSQEEIADLQIFSVTSIEHYDQGDENFQKIKLKLKEGKHQTVSFVARYFSGEKFGGTASWKHRNIFCNAEQFDVSAKYSQTGKALIGTFVKPDIFGSVTHKLFIQMGKIVSDQFAYSTDLLKMTGGLKYKFSKTLTASSLFTIENDMQDSPTWDSLQYLSVGVKYDTRDSTSDPTKGWLSSFDVIPYFSNQASQIPVQFKLQQTAYVPLGSVIYGINFKGGTFANASLKDILKHKQYFGGGDGSVRGYGPQSLTVGGLDADGVPEMGALSKVELTQEMRVKVNEDFGMVAFIDLGIFSKHMNPFKNISWMKETGFEKQESPLSCSVGLGFNYLSIIGPVRVDVAFPIVRRKFNDKFVDDIFEFYLRFGQGF